MKERSFSNWTLNCRLKYMRVECKVQIIEIMDDSFYPGICKAVLTDYYGKEHIIIDKPPVFGFELEEVSEIPFESSMCCEMTQDLGDHVVIDIDDPFHFESEDALTVFTVSKSQIVEGSTI